MEIVPAAARKMPAVASNATVHAVAANPPPAGKPQHGLARNVGRDQRTSVKRLLWTGRAYRGNRVARRRFRGCPTASTRLRCAQTNGRDPEGQYSDRIHTDFLGPYAMFAEAGVYNVYAVAASADVRTLT